MAVIPPWAIDAQDGAPEYDGAALRAIAAAGLLTQSADPTRARPGVLSGLDVVVLDDVVYVAPGLAVVDGDKGAYVTGVADEAALVLEARHATNPRRDRLVLRVFDQPGDAGGDIEVITGEPAPSPVAPAVPTNAENLGVIDVPIAGGAGAVFTDERRFTSARGGTVLVPSAAALSRVSDPQDGDTARVLNGRTYERRDGQWADRIDEIPAAYLRQDTGQSIPNGTLTTQQFDVVEKMRGGMTLGSSGGVVVPRAGWYSVHAGTRWASNASGSRQLRILHNGTVRASGVEIPNATGGFSHAVSHGFYAEPGDQIYTQVYHSAGGTLLTSPNFGMPYMSVIWHGE